jgi:hypothetical protein
MLGFKKKSGPTRPFAHAIDCKILKADPDVEIPWQEIESGLWVAECICSKEYEREAPADRRLRLNPVDPDTFRHLPGCEHRDTTDVSIVKAILRVQDREGYWRVDCAACDGCWQVPYYAAESGG